MLLFHGSDLPWPFQILELSKAAELYSRLITQHINSGSQSHFELLEDMQLFSIGILLLKPILYPKNERCFWKLVINKSRLQQYCC